MKKAVGQRGPERLRFVQGCLDQLWVDWFFFFHSVFKLEDNCFIVLLVSAVQKCESAISIYIPSWVSFPLHLHATPLGYHRALSWLISWIQASRLTSDTLLTVNTDAFCLEEQK